MEGARQSTIDHLEEHGESGCFLTRTAAKQKKRRKASERQ